MSSLWAEWISKGRSEDIIEYLLHSCKYFSRLCVVSVRKSYEIHDYWEHEEHSKHESKTNHRMSDMINSTFHLLFISSGDYKEQTSPNHIEDRDKRRKNDNDSYRMPHEILKFKLLKYSIVHKFVV